MKNAKVKPELNYASAVDLFNEIAGASYFGVSFRAILAADPEAHAAATKLVERLKANHAPGLSKHE